MPDNITELEAAASEASAKLLDANTALSMARATQKSAIISNMLAQITKYDAWIAGKDRDGFLMVTRESDVG